MFLLLGMSVELCSPSTSNPAHQENSVKPVSKR